MPRPQAHASSTHPSGNGSVRAAHLKNRVFIIWGHRIIFPAWYELQGIIWGKGLSIPITKNPIRFNMP